MREEKLSVRQLSVTAFTGALSPAVAAAGYGWQGALLAVPVLLLAGGAMAGLAPRWAALETTWTGKALAVLYALWGAALLSRGLARCAGRILHTGGGSQSHFPWLVVLLALPLAWVAWGKPAAYFRGAELCYLAALVTAGALCLWALFRVQWDYVLEPAGDLWAGFGAALEAGGTFLFALPYCNRIKTAPGDRGRGMGWLLAAAVSTAALSFVTAGALSPALAVQAEDPFFLMTAALGRTARVEGLASSLWLLPDLVYLGLLARSWQWSGTKQDLRPVAAVIVGAAMACTGVFDGLPQAVWTWGTAVLWAVILAALLFVQKNSVPAEGKDTSSCGSEET